MKPEFTAEGISVQTFQEIYDELAQGYRDIYGDDINLDPDSPDGQRVGIEAQARLDLQTFGLALYQQLDPDFAVGTALNRLIKLSGIQRRPATRSQVDVTITTDRPLTLPADYAAQDALGQKWLTLSEVALTAGSNSVTLFAEEFGAVEAGIGTVTEQATFVIGVLSINNAAEATVGSDEETDEQLRIRRNQSLQNPALSTVGGLFGRIANTAGVTDVIVYENDTDSFDGGLLLAAHSIWCVIEGGAVDDLVEVIAKNKTAGTGIKGSVSGTYSETRIRPDGSTFIVPHVMKFDRPVDTPLYVQMTVTRTSASSPVDLELIKSLLSERSFYIGQGVQAGDLYRTVYGAGDNFILTDLQISLDDVTYTDGAVTIDPDGKLSIDVSDVDVTEVIP